MHYLVAEEDSDSRKKNKKILKQEPKETTQIKRDYDLPPVMEQKHSNAGMRAADLDILKAATNDLFKKQRDTYDPYSDFDPSYDPLKPMKAEEGKSLRELMKEKMEKMEKVESVDDRKTRLKAQRDLLIKQKQDVRQTELNRCPSLKLIWLIIFLVNFNLKIKIINKSNHHIHTINKQEF